MCNIITLRSLTVKEIKVNYFTKLIAKKALCAIGGKANILPLRVDKHFSATNKCALGGETVTRETHIKEYAPRNIHT